MLIRLLFAILVVCAAPPPPSIDKLVDDLGSESFQTREDAEKLLRSTGRPVLPALLKAKQDKDLERKYRAARIYRSIFVPLFDEKAEKTVAHTIKIKIASDPNTRRYSQTELSGLVVRAEKNEKFIYVLTVASSFDGVTSGVKVIFKDKGKDAKGKVIDKEVVAKIYKVDKELDLAMIRYESTEKPPAAVISDKGLAEGNLCQSGCNYVSGPKLNKGYYTPKNGDNPENMDIEISYGDAGAGIFQLENFNEMKVVAIVHGASWNSFSYSPLFHRHDTIKKFMKDIKYK